MSDPDFQRVFPDVIIDNNKKSVERLGTMSAGVIHAIPTTGKLTGKGAGSLAEGFAGLMSIDDVIKPDDANSPTERDKINARYSNTLLSRLNSVTTPLVIIMQRLHEEDLCGYLMKGGSSDTFAWLNIPGIITPETGSKEWYDKIIDMYGYTHVDPLYYKLKEGEHRKYEERDFPVLGSNKTAKQLVSSFWPVRKTLDSLLGLLKKDSYTFFSQYMGMPVGKGKSALTSDMINTYESVDTRDIRYTFVTADTASTTKTYSDYTVACFWGVSRRKQLYLLDVVIDKWETPDLVIEMRKFWKLCKKQNKANPNMKPRGFYMEDKSSGLFLNQQFLKDGTVNVKPVPRDGTGSNDKFTRFLSTIPYFKEGRILLPKNHEHYIHMRKELLGQTAFGSSTGHDDFVDNVSDASVIAFDAKSMNYDDWS